MTDILKRRSVDLLVEQFWRKGYLTLSRKFGTYLPEPDSVGGFEVDIIARQKNKYAIGITIVEEDFKDQNRLLSKLSYLANRQTRAGNLPVMLFLGIKSELLNSLRSIIDQLDEKTKKNIRIFQISENRSFSLRGGSNASQPLFS
ncbi:MAG: hypothetical protein HXY50_03105 [Ignavibacteriaceae bacterium]|nr:hypothetical protein [Ignavibacteriaceae bacterium]